MANGKRKKCLVFVLFVWVGANLTSQLGHFLYSLIPYSVPEVGQEFERVVVVVVQNPVLHEPCGWCPDRSRPAVCLRLLPPFRWGQEQSLGWAIFP